jgi:L-aminopeptidase/D-esterase-like protein
MGTPGYPSSARAASSLGFGFRVGHWSDPAAETGCTVVLPPPANVTSVDIRGTSPGSRELPSLDVERTRTDVHGILLSGGSAFGLDAASGVMEWLEEQGIGHPIGVTVIPIVPAAVIFDLGFGRHDVRPGPKEGRAACEDARADDIATGRVGVGTGATVGKWAGRDFASPGGIGIAVAERDGERVSAIAVANPVGDVIGPDGAVIAGTSNPDPRYTGPPGAPDVPDNTVLAVVATQANLTKQEVRFIAARGADGVTVSVRPAHTRYDGDVVFACAAPDPSGRVADVDVLGHLATEAVGEAVRSAVRPK